MTTDYDVIIVGAGPAGITCAKKLSENGISHIVVESKRIPKIKCCSGIYSDRAIKVIESEYGKLPDDLWCENRSVNVEFSKDGIHFIPIPMLRFWNLHRNDVDLWMLNKSNINLKEHCLYVDYDINNEIITVKIKENGYYKKYTCRYLIGADGAKSKIRKKIDVNFNNLEFGCAYQCIYKGTSNNLQKDRYYVIINKDMSEYFAAIHWKDDSIYIATTISKNNFCYTSLFDQLKRTFELNVSEIRKEGCNHVYYTNKENLFFGKGNILLAGESTGMVSLYNEGIFSAIISGQMLSQSIIKSLKTGINVITDYKEGLEKEINYIDKAWASFRKRI